MTPREWPIAFALLAVLGVLVYVRVRFRQWITLSQATTVMLAGAAAFAGLALCGRVLWGADSLGDFDDARLIIVLGGVAMTWASVTAISGALPAGSVDERAQPLSGRRTERRELARGREGGAGRASGRSTADN